MKELDVMRVHKNARQFAADHKIHFITAKTIDSPDYVVPLNQVDAAIHWHWTNKPEVKGIVSIRVGKRRPNSATAVDVPFDKISQFRDVFLPEQIGPLTPEEHDEYLDHFLRGMTCIEAVEHIEYHERIALSLFPGDPAYARTQRELSSTCRYLELARRFRDHGVAETITLTETFPKD